MGNLKFFENMVDKKLLDLHTAFLAQVLSVSEKTAKIQPLGMTKETGGTARKYAPIPSAAITRQVRENISVGDIAVCICCDRDITEAKQGKNVLPPPGHHSMSDCVIIGTL